MSTQEHKILIVFPYLPKYDVEFFDNLTSKSNYDIYVAADVKSKNQLTLDSYVNKNYTVLHTDMICIGPFVYTKGLNKIIKKIKPDLIIYNANPRDVGQFLSILKSKISGRQIAAWSMFHRIGGPIVWSSLYYKFLGHIMNRNMTYSNTGKTHQIVRGVSTSKIDVIGTAINEQSVFKTIKAEGSSSNSELVEKYDLNGKIILLQIVRLTEIKKPFLLIDMIKCLVKKNDQVRLILIGGGLLETQIIKYVHDCNLGDYIKILGPIYDEKILGQWFNIADVFVIPTCIGLSAHHACCYGLPIVTDNSIINQASEFDILTDRYNCLLYEENDLDSFAEKALELVTNKALYQSISENAIKTVRDKFTLDNKVNNFIKSVEKILV
jgi:glycosyltransferase involved in cell wall biosynthesis